MKVLLIEDDKFLRLLLERKLKNANFEVVSAEDGEEALEKIVTEKPDLILLDIILPKKSGFSVLEEINKDENLKRIPVFIISNLGRPEDIERGKNLGAKEYFVKAGLSLEGLIKKITMFTTEFLSTK